VYAVIAVIHELLVPHFVSVVTVASGRQSSAVRQYHVLFFGDEGERGWVLESTGLPYAGRAAFDAHCQAMMAKVAAKDRKNYSVAANRRRAWEVAVSSAEHAWMLSREQRIDEFIPPITNSGRWSLSSSDADGQILTGVDAGRLLDPTSSSGGSVSTQSSENNDRYVRFFVNI